MSVVTAQQAALATNLTKAVAVVDRMEHCVVMIESKLMSGAAALLLHLKHSMKQLQLWQSVAGITASQLLAVAALMDNVAAANADEVDFGGLLSAAIASHHTSGLAWRAGWHHSSSPVLMRTAQPLMYIATVLASKIYPVSACVPFWFGRYVILSADVLFG